MPEPFFVLATQNPIEQEGTYPLPEAQLDRFMFKVVVGYPNARRGVGDRAADDRPSRRRAGTSSRWADRFCRLQELVRQVVVADHVFQLCRRSGAGDPAARSQRRRSSSPELLAWGAGPRASQYLILGGKARAILQGRLHVTTEDIREVAHPVLRHRLITTFNADAEGVTTDQVITRLLDAVPPPHKAAVQSMRRV